MNLQEFYEVFMPVVEYYKADLSKAVIGLYFDELKEHKASNLREALKALLRSRKYANMPSIAEILEHLGGSMEERAQHALDELIYGLNRYGTYRSVCFKDKIIMCVVQAVGGWEELGKLEGDDWKWFKQKRFSELYKIYAKTPHLAPSYLAGTSEKENSFLGRGHKHDKIYFIGEDKNAVNVLEFKQILAREKLQSPVAAMLSGINKAAV